MSTLPIKAILFALFTLGANVYGAWTQWGWPAGVGAGAGLLIMLAAIFGIGRRKQSGSALQQMREKAMKRWTCRKCGTKCAPKSVACLNCGENL